LTGAWVNLNMILVGVKHFRDTLFHLCLCCCSTGSISWVTATPADVVKSRLQADAMEQRKYKGIIDCIMQSYKKEGIHVSL